MADWLVGFALVVLDKEGDGFVAGLALGEAVDEAVVHGGALVHDTGDEGFANGYGELLMAGEPAVAGAEGDWGTLALAEEVELLLPLGELDNLEGVASGWEHALGGLYGVGGSAVVDGEGAFGVEFVSGGSVNDYLHNILNNL